MRRRRGDMNPNMRSAKRSQQWFRKLALPATMLIIFWVIAIVFWWSSGEVFFPLIFSVATGRVCWVV